MNDLTLKECFLIFFGFGFRVNHNSREIHRISNKQHNCKHELMSKNTSEYVTRSTAERLISRFNYNGCRWCWKVQDKG